MRLAPQVAERLQGMGKVMGLLKEQLQGWADMDKLGRQVEGQLSP